MLVGVDGSPSALQAVRWAAREAARRRVPLQLVHATGPFTVPHEYADLCRDPRLRELVNRRGSALIAEAAAAAIEAAPGIEVRREVQPGYPIAPLTADSHVAQLLVLGNRGLGGVNGLPVGSVAAALATHAACPVVVVHGPTPDAPAPADGPVVVGVDGSPVSEAALAFAFAAADGVGADLVAVHVWTDSAVDPQTAQGYQLGPVFDWGAVEQQERALLGERLAGWGEKYPDVRVERVVTRERAARALVERSGRARLLVVGSHGRDSTESAVWSVSHAVLQRARCPVAVVHPEPPVGKP